MNSLYHQFGFDQLSTWMEGSGMAAWAEVLPDQVKTGLDQKRFGDLPGWLELFEALPDVTAEEIELSSEIALRSASLTAEQQAQLEAALRGMIPWRKGPYNLFDIHLNTEWRSDWKWDRVLPHIQPLQHRNVLDVGCGNGYHMWRMLGAGAKRVIGVDPSPRFSIQFEMIKQLAGSNLPVHLVPCAMEQIPRALEAFDSVFSMGVLYHRKSPIDHLYELRDALAPGGQLILETLVVRGDENTCLVPNGRYAKMRNVWFIPSSKNLEVWLARLGFKDIRTVDENQTSIEEQRSTDWMLFESLPDFLDPNDADKTIEGHPAPLRTVIVANKPKEPLNKQISQ